jgi:hypothetical protein
MTGVRVAVSRGLDRAHSIQRFTGVGLSRILSADAAKAERLSGVLIRAGGGSRSLGAPQARKGRFL